MFILTLVGEDGRAAVVRVGFGGAFPRTARGAAVLLHPARVLGALAHRGPVLAAAVFILARASGRARVGSRGRGGGGISSALGWAAGRAAVYLHPTRVLGTLTQPGPVLAAAVVVRTTPLCGAAVCDGGGRLGGARVGAAGRPARSLHEGGVDAALPLRGPEGTVGVGVCALANETTVALSGGGEGGLDSRLESGRQCGGSSCWTGCGHWRCDGHRLNRRRRCEVRRNE